MLHAMPSGLYLGVPLDADAFMATGLLANKANAGHLRKWNCRPRATTAMRLRMHLLPERRKRRSGHSWNAGFGREMVTCIFEPLLAGIYAGDLYALGLDATFPQFKAYEQQYGSVIRGIQASLSAAKQAPTGKSVGSCF